MNSHGLLVSLLHLFSGFLSGGLRIFSLVSSSSISSIVSLNLFAGSYSNFPWTNLIFGVDLGLCGYFYFCTMLYEPGYVPKLGGLTEQKEVIDELLSLWKYDDQNFCVTCMVRMPLRSKHCKRCNRCIAKHDQ